jgi:hypothetical protein
MWVFSDWLSYTSRSASSCDLSCSHAAPVPSIRLDMSSSTVRRLLTNLPKEASMAPATEALISASSCSLLTLTTICSLGASGARGAGSSGAAASLCLTMPLFSPEAGPGEGGEALAEGRLDALAFTPVPPSRSAKKSSSMAPCWLAQRDAWLPCRSGVRDWLGSPCSGYGCELDRDAGRFGPSVRCRLAACPRASHH